MTIDIEYRFFTLSDATIAMVQLDRGTEKSRDNLSPMLVPEEMKKHYELQLRSSLILKVRYDYLMLSLTSLSVCVWKSGLDDQEVHYSARVFPDFWSTSCFSESHSVHISIQGAMRIDMEYRFFSLSDATIAMVQLDRGTEKSRRQLQTF